MPIAYPAVLDLKEENQHITWNDRDVMLYALALGMGTTDRELDFVYEKNLKVIPTLVAVAAYLLAAAGAAARQGTSPRMRSQGPSTPAPAEAALPSATTSVSDARRDG